ncbi:MAG: glucose-1-phosphate adenylyltransferase subunit GlgD [Clostridiales bacterium]|nr:glucose-1-phosphate adenylyltransferase subunit GlgD [Clostridiales bacterium]
MSTAGIIFANLHDSNLPELTRQRSMGSVPFLCRYRFIDFALSNMVNADISSIGILAHYNYYSLMDHIGSGKNWDLARRSGGIQILPPNVSAYAETPATYYNTRLEALKYNIFNIERIQDDLILMCQCDCVANFDFGELLSEHESSGADITIVTKKVHLTTQESRNHVIFDSNSDGKITDIHVKPNDITGYKDVSLNVIVISKKLLVTLIHDAISHNFTSFYRDIISRNLTSKNIKLFRWDGYYADILNFEDYFRTSMDLISNEENRNAVFGIRNRPVLTKVRNSPPTVYGDNCKVSNSLIADGCIIEGKVENSILFRGVKIGRNACIKNSILFQGAQIGEHVSLNCVVSDKNTTIRDRSVLSGNESLPYYISKGRMI